MHGRDKVKLLGSLNKIVKLYELGVPCDLGALDVHGLQDFGDTLKVGLLVFLELWLRTYPLSCGSG